METVEELKRYVRFLYSSLQEKDRENRQVRDEIKAELKAANRRADFDGTEKSLPEGAPGPVGKSHT